MAFWAAKLKFAPAPATLDACCLTLNQHLHTLLNPPASLEPGWKLAAELRTLSTGDMTPLKKIGSPAALGRRKPPYGTYGPSDHPPLKAALLQAAEFRRQTDPDWHCPADADLPPHLVEEFAAQTAAAQEAGMRRAQAERERDARHGPEQLGHAVIDTYRALSGNTIRFSRAASTHPLAGRPRGPLIRFLQAFYAALREFIRRLPQGLRHVRSRALNPCDETLARWIRNHISVLKRRAIAEQDFENDLRTAIYRRFRQYPRSAAEQRAHREELTRTPNRSVVLES